MVRHVVAVLLLLAGLIPALSAAQDEQYWEYTFRPGDTIWNIASEYTNDVNNWREIQRLNGIPVQSDREIQPGTRIQIPVSMLKRPPQPAIVIALEGAVRIVRQDGSEAELSEGDKLYVGDKVLTGQEQSLRIRFADGSSLQILANSEVSMDKLSYHEDTGMVDTRVRLQQGRVNTWVEKLRPRSRYQIQTPAAITAVRGTAYRLISGADLITRTEVTEGSVNVSSGGETRAVETGFGLVIEKDKPLPKPVKLLGAPEIGANAASGDVLDIRWNRLEGASSYRYQVSRDAAFNRIVTDRATEQTGFRLADLEPGAYFVRVRAIDSLSLEGLNALRQFEIAALPPPSSNKALDEVIIPSGILLLGQ